MDDKTNFAAELPSEARMPLLGFGTWQMSHMRAYESVRTALDVGYRHIDTATMYENESEIGRALRDSGLPREDLFVTTKLPPERAGREAETLRASLDALGTGYVDLWLIHWPPRRGRSPQIWERFVEARRDGLARDIGVSNYDVDQLDALTESSGVTPAVNQIPWSPRLFDGDVLAGHRERGVVLEGYSPFKRSNLLDPVLRDIAKAHGVTAAQVVLRWHLELGVVAIPKSKTPERIASNFDVFGFSLTPDEVERINGLGRP